MNKQETIAELEQVIVDVSENVYDDKPVSVSDLMLKLERIREAVMAFPALEWRKLEAGTLIPLPSAIGGTKCNETSYASWDNSADGWIEAGYTHYCPIPPLPTLK